MEMPMNLGIEDIEYYLPSNIITSHELSGKHKFPLDFIEKKIGVKTLYQADKDEMVSDMGVEAVSKLFTRRPELRDQIGVVVVCTQTPDFQLPHSSAIIQHKLNLPHDVACFDINLGCSGFVYGLSVVTTFMKCNEIDYGLLITAETYSKIIDENDRNTKPIFSDAAAVTLIGKRPLFLPMKFTFGTGGENYDSLISGSRYNPQSKQHPSLHMDGRRVFGMVASEIPNDIFKCLKINGLDKEDIDIFVFHQASLFMLNTLTDLLGIEDAEKVIKCIDKFGNTVSSSIPIAMKYYLDQKPKRMPKKILISGFGVGFSWASTILSSNGGM